MTNPVSQIPSAQIPLYTQQLTDENGMATPLFHRFLVGLYERTGGAQGASTSDATTIAQQALNTAAGALSAAELAESTAQSAESAAAASQATATTALSVGTQSFALGQSLQNTTMLRSNNLSDVANVSTSRQNLGITTIPLSFNIDTLTSNFKRSLPIVQSLMVPANCAGSIVWWGTGATSDTLLTIQRTRSGVVVPVGNLTFSNHATGYSFSAAAFGLLAGDVLVVECPSVPDATLADIAITLLARIT